MEGVASVTDLSEFFTIETIYGDFKLSYFLAKKLQKSVQNSKGFSMFFTEKLSSIFYMNLFFTNFFEADKLQHEEDESLEDLYLYTLKFADSVVTVCKKGYQDIEHNELHVLVTKKFKEIHAVGLERWKVARPVWTLEAESYMTYREKFHPFAETEDLDQGIEE